MIGSPVSGQRSFDHSPLSARTGDSGPRSIVPDDVNDAALRGSHTRSDAISTTRSRHVPPPWIRSASCTSSAAVSVPSTPIESRCASIAIEPLTLGNRPAGIQGEPSNWLARSVPISRGASVRLSALPPKLSCAGSVSRTSAPRRSRSPPTAPENRYSCPSGSRQCPASVPLTPSGSAARNRTSPASCPSGSVTEIDGTFMTLRSISSDPVIAATANLWPFASTSSTRRRSSAPTSSSSNRGMKCGSEGGCGSRFRIVTVKAPVLTLAIEIVLETRFARSGSSRRSRASIRTAS